MSEKQKLLKVYSIRSLSIESVNRKFFNRLYQVLGTVPQLMPFTWVDDDIVYLHGSTETNGSYLRVDLKGLYGGFVELWVNDLNAVADRLQQSGLMSLRILEDDSKNHLDPTRHNHMYFHRAAQIDALIEGIRVTFVVPPASFGFENADTAE